MRWMITVFLLLSSFSVHSIEAIIVKGLFKNMAIVTIDGKRRTLKLNETSPEGATLISANSESAIIESNGQRNTYRLGQHISSSFQAPPAKSQVVITPDKMGMYHVNGSINGFQVKFLVDTGATLIAMNEIQAKRMGLDYKLSGVPGQTSTASGIAKAWYIVLEKVKVGSLKLRKVDAVVIKGQHPRTVLLGNSFLNRFQMVRNGKIMELSTQ